MSGPATPVIRAPEGGEGCELGAEPLPVRRLGNEDRQRAAAEVPAVLAEGGGRHPERDPGGPEPHRRPDRVVGIPRHQEGVAGVRVRQRAGGGGRIGEGVRKPRRFGSGLRRESRRLRHRPRREAVGERDRPGGDVVEGVGGGPDVRVPEARIGAPLPMFRHPVEELPAEAGLLFEEHLRQPALRLGAGDHEAPGRQRRLAGRAVPREHRPRAARRRRAGGAPDLDPVPQQQAQHRIEAGGVPVPRDHPAAGAAFRVERPAPVGEVVPQPPLPGSPR